MDNNKDGKRRRDKQDDDSDKRKEKKSRRERSRSKSPTNDRDKGARRKRRHSKSRSPDVPVKHEKPSNLRNDAEIKREVPERRARDTDMLNTRTGGAYIPPARLRMMQAQITDKSSIAYQRLAWEALKKSIHGHINKINVGNIGIIIKELLKENIVRGRGLLCRSVIQAQAASPTFTNVYAALVSAVNSRFPNIGELLLKRLVIQFKRGFKRNDKASCISSVSFVAHLINQRVAHEILALELLTLLVESPTDDSVEVAIAFLKECGQKLTEVSSKGVNAIFEMLRNILHEGQLDKRVQYMIEVMFQVWKDGFKDHPALIEELELVPEEEQFTHLLMLDEATDPQDILNVFKFDEKYEENEQKYKNLSKEILGSDAESGEEDGSGESGSEESEDEEDEEPQKPITIIDNTETNLVALRRTIYLTINSSLDFEECAHKLMRMQLKPGQEVELCHMFLDCCAEQRTYEKFYGLLAQRFCNLNRIYVGPFEEIFKDSYSTAHRLDTNRLRNVSKFFAHLLFTDSISWEVLECVKLNEEDTTSSSRIYIKILFQELAEYMGLKKLNDRLKDPTLQDAFSGVFPRDNPKNTRFSINFFTSIGLGGLTDELREHLKQMPKNVPPPITDINIESSSSSSSSEDSSSSSSDSSSSDSDDEGGNKKKKGDSNKKKSKKKDKTPKTPVEEPEKAERWGHDGFYDTYGQGARREESRPDRRENDRDNFVRPGDRRENNRRNNRDGQDNSSDRRDRRYDNNRDEFSKDDTRNREDVSESGRNRRENRDGNNVESKRSDFDRRDRGDRRNEDREVDKRSGRERNDQRRIERDRNDDRDTRNNRENDDRNTEPSDRSRDRDRRKEYRDRDDERRNDDKRNNREKDDHRRNDREFDDSRRKDRDRRDAEKVDRREKDNDGQKDTRDKNDDRRNNYRERERQKDLDRDTDNDRQEDEDSNATSKRRDREDKLERYWNASEKSKHKDSDSDDQRSRNKTKSDRHERGDRKKEFEEEENRKKQRRDKMREEDNGNGRHQVVDEDRRKKSKQCSDSEEKSSRKKKQKKKDKRVEESSDGSDEEEAAGNRYWDDMDLKNKNEDIKQVKVSERARRARS